MVDRRLYWIGLTGLAALNVVATACAEARPNINPSHSPVPATAGPVAGPSPEAQVSEKRQKGILLENLDFSKVQGNTLENSRLHKVGKISVAKFSENYDLLLDPKQLLQMADQCGANRIPKNFYVEISEKVFAPDQTGQIGESDAYTTTDGVTISTLLALDALYVTGLKDLDLHFEVDSQKKVRALENLAVLALNKSLVTSLCAAVIVEEEGQKGTPPQQRQLEVQKAYQTSERYRDQLLAGQAAPVLVVRKKTSPSSI